MTTNLPTNLDWNLFSLQNNISESVIRKYKDHVKWFYICQYSNLSENFIREHKNYV